jgi:uncharacterized lipoprotein YehR (DUF1307 family)
MIKKTFFIIAVFTLISCDNKQNNETLEEINKKSAREVTLSTVTKGDTVYHLTKQTIWYNGEKIKQTTDTIITKLIENSWETDSTKIEKLNQIPIYVTVQ